MKRYGWWAGVAAAGVCVAAVFYLASDRRQIRRQLDALASAAASTGTESDVERLARAARVAAYFTDDVVIRRSEDNSAFVGGRSAVAAMAASAADRAATTVAIENVDVTVTGDGAASAGMTVVVTRRRPDLESVEIRQVSASLRKVNGAWLISQAQVQPSREGQ